MTLSRVGGPMRALPFAVLASLLVAGCFGSSHSSSSSSTAAPTSSSLDEALGGSSGSHPARELPTTLEAPTVRPELKLGPGSGEPSIAVAPDGTIYVSAIEQLYRSRDGGASFVSVGAPGCTFPFGIQGTPCPPGQETVTATTDGHGDGDVVVDGAGRLHWLGLGTGIPYQVSDDGGATWSKAADVSNGTGSDREWMDLTPAGHLATAWRDANGYAFNGSFDAGATWNGKVKVSDDFLGGPIIHDPVHPATLYIPGVTFPPGPSVPPSNEPGSGAGLYLFKSENDGRNWTSIRILDLRVSAADLFFVTQIFPVVAADQAGNLYMVLSTKLDLVPNQAPKPASIFGVYLFTSTDGGSTWGTPRLLSTPLKAAVLPFVVAGAQGRIAVVWYEGTVGLPNDVLPDLWNVKLYEGLGQDQGAGTSVVVQLNRLPNHIGSLCTNGTLCLAGGDRCLLDFFEVALDNGGLPVVTWANCSGGTGVGVAAVPTTIYFGGVAKGTPLW